MIDKPKEYFIIINNNAEGDGSKSFSLNPWCGYIHVIEFDPVIKQMEEIRKALDECKQLICPVIIAYKNAKYALANYEMFLESLK